MKILIEGMTSGRGGKESYIMNIFRAMNKQDRELTFISYDPHIAFEEELRKAGAEIVKLPPRSAGIIRFRRALNNYLKNNHFDVLWAHKTTLSSCEILEIAKKVNIPIRIVHSHSSANMGGKVTYLMHSLNKRRIFRIATDYLACSDVAAKWFYSNHDCVIVKNGFDLDKFRYSPKVREEIRTKYKLHGCFVIGHVGRFGAEKNHIKLLDIFFEYNKQHANSRLVLCGDGEERPKIESKIKELGITDEVLLLGIVNNVNEILQAIDVIVMPSLFEGLPYSLLEAQAAGLKCIVSDTVSRESDVIGWNKYVSLDAPESEWADVINELDCHYDREGMADIIKHNGFDIYDCVKQVEAIINK